MVDIAAGSTHSLALKGDTTVWVAGYNAYGQLGDGTTTQRETPVQVPNLTNVVAVAAGTYHALALKSDDLVWAWGYNGSGQLGDGTTTNRLTPVQVQNLTNVKAIASSATANHSLALKRDGTVWAWGNNQYGQLGDGTTTQRNTPVQVQNLTNVKAIAAGQGHSLALKTDGTVRAWGYNQGGDLGDGTTANNRLTPVQVQGLNDAVAMRREPMCPGRFAPTAAWWSGAAVQPSACPPPWSGWATRDVDSPDRDAAAERFLLPSRVRGCRLLQCHFEHHHRLRFGPRRFFAGDGVWRRSFNQRRCVLLHTPWREQRRYGTGARALGLFLRDAHLGNGHDRGAIGRSSTFLRLHPT
jgi:hypothetical protein